MKKLIIACLIVLSCTMFNNAKGQQTILAIDTIFFPYNAAFCCDSTYSFDIKVSNQGIVQYNGTFDIVYLTDKMIANMVSPAVMDSGQQMILNPGNIMQYTIGSFVFDTTNNFKIGGNIVVVWPRGGSGTIFTPDTFRTEIYVWPYFSSINQNEQTKETFNICPNPVVSQINLVGLGNKIKPEEVRIFDLVGNCVHETGFTTAPINVATLKNGIYILQLKMQNGEMNYRKFVVNR